MKPFLSKFLLAAFAVLAPIHDMLAACLFLVAVDLLTGVIKAVKQKQTLKSSGFRQTLIKLFVYEMAIILGFVTQKFLMNDSMPLTNIIAGYIGLTELLSVMENLNAISGGQLLKALLEKLGSVQKP